jgi:tetratricopeptide (TPR) repeat protein
MKVRLLLLGMLCFGFNSYGQVGNDYYKLGKLNAENKDFKGAIINFTKAIEIEDHKNYPQALAIYLLERGNSKERLNDFRGAISDLTSSIDYLKVYILTSSNPNENTINVMRIIYTSRAYAKLGMEDLDGALLDVNEALELSPRSGELFKLRGEIKILLGQKDSACLDFSRAGELGADGAYERINGNCN